MSGHAPEVHRPLRSSTVSTIAGARTASPESNTRRSTRRKRGAVPSDTPHVSTSSDQKPVPWIFDNGVEGIDLTEADSDENNLLAKAQEDLLRMQKADGQEKPKLADFKCVICLDDPKDLAATPCGHMFCDFCLQGALRAGQPPNAKHGRCPVCRRKVNIKDVVPLEIKVLSKLKSKGKGKDKAG